MSFALGPSFTALILASGFLVLGLSRPLYAAPYAAALVLLLSVSAVGRLFRSPEAVARSDRGRSGFRRLALATGFCCYVLFVAIVLFQVSGALYLISTDAPLPPENYAGFNLNLTIFIPLANLLLIYSGYQQVHRRRDFEHFLKTYVLAISVIWHLSFLIWLIEDNAVLFHYSEWSSSVFSGPLINANHAALITTIAAAYYALQLIDMAALSSRVMTFNRRAFLYVAQVLIFAYYSLTSGSQMMYLVFFLISAIIFVYALPARARNYLLILSASGFLILAIAYFSILLGADEHLVPVASVQDRQIIARETIALIMERPWLGYGTGSAYSVLLGRSIEAIPDLIFTSAHSYYLDFLLQYGVLGFIAAFLGVFAIPMACWIAFNRGARLVSPLGLFIWILWLALLISSLSDFGLAIPAISMLLCFLTGAIYRLFIQEGAPVTLLDDEVAPSPRRRRTG
ncbi:O-antigen ligase family protein [Minwuia thermotolerans]|uniref:O-antigen ligase-related domain-containing protein n=1 Tax=Minwuia thermotolerans TaxID=2056226 RepID=A0A2M9G7R3_9PROT|nr:O-antigen ligase family protein [Minwuia thermotolerans]PJK31742.1 hypothetical protein CVT23_00015 [Minwuia thermotolerans]